MWASRNKVEVGQTGIFMDASVALDDVVDERPGCCPKEAPGRNSRWKRVWLSWMVRRSTIAPDWMDGRV